MKYTIPKINKRIRLIINLKADGNISGFAKITGVSQQRLTRLFIPDKKANGKYPTIPSELLIAIAKNFKDIDLNWLLTGEGTVSDTYNEMKKPEALTVHENKVKYGNNTDCEDKDYIINLQKEVISSLKEQLNIAIKKGSR